MAKEKINELFSSLQNAQLRHPTTYYSQATRFRFNLRKNSTFLHSSVICSIIIILHSVLYCRIWQYFFDTSYIQCYVIIIKMSSVGEYYNIFHYSPTEDIALGTVSAFILTSLILVFHYKTSYTDRSASNSAYIEWQSLVLAHSPVTLYSVLTHLILSISSFSNISKNAFKEITKDILIITTEHKFLIFLF